MLGGSGGFGIGMMICGGAGTYIIRIVSKKTLRFNGKVGGNKISAIHILDTKVYIVTSNTFWHRHD